MHIPQLTVWAYVLLIAAVSAQGTGVGRAPNVTPSSDAEAAVKAARELITQREQVIQRLIKVADSPDGFPVPQDKEAQEFLLYTRYAAPKASAIRLLGRLRAEEAVPALIRNLTYEIQSSAGGYSINTPVAKYPCINALAAIGAPAVEPLKKKVLESDNELEGELALLTLVKAQGVIVTERILELSRRYAMPDVRERIDRALAELEKKHGHREEIGFDGWYSSR